MPNIERGKQVMKSVKIYNNISVNESEAPVNESEGQGYPFRRLRVPGPLRGLKARLPEKRGSGGGVRRR